jgi:hypothetical protein
MPAVFADITLAWFLAIAVKIKNLEIPNAEFFERTKMTLGTKNFSAMMPPILGNQPRFLKFYRILAVFKALYY